jgi:hypothetical protein
VTRTRFEWDPAKDEENERKHGVSFVEAQYAFADPHRVIAEDLVHSQQEPRYFCFGRVGEGIVTVRFTYRAGVIRIFSAGYWRRGKWSMSSRIKYTDEPLGDLKVIADFLPPPEQLAFREEGVKVTIALSKRSVEFFKAEAARHHTQYQRMIRRLVDAYVDAYQPEPESPKRPPRRRSESGR